LMGVLQSAHSTGTDVCRWSVWSRWRGCVDCWWEYCSLLWVNGIGLL